MPMGYRARRWSNSTTVATTTHRRCGLCGTWYSTIVGIMQHTCPPTTQVRIPPPRRVPERKSQ